jgi:hypothetical protein
MFRSLLRDRKLIILFFLAVLIRIFASSESWVERYYTYGFYPYISSAMRILLGWIPFSVGDVVYVLAFIFLVLKTWKLLKLLAGRQVKEYLSWILFRKYLRLVLWIYIIFNVSWGLNYNRLGIAHQLGLDLQPYTTEDVYQLALVLREKVNAHAVGVDSIYRNTLDSDNKELFRLGIENFKRAARVYPFLKYDHPSIKPSLFTPVGHYFGFTGYYNPFSGEAQLKTSVPVFVKPFILCHEIAHQLGYGKENEANLVAFLAARTSDNKEFLYSAYYDVFVYTIRELARLDPDLFLQLRQGMHPGFRQDYLTYLQYIYRNRNIVEPFISDFYDSYLRMNNQPQGKRTYNEVVSWLIAYGKKYGNDDL